MKKRGLPDRDMARFFSKATQIKTPERVIQNLQKMIAAEDHAAETSMRIRSGVLSLRRQLVMAVVLTLLIAVPLTFFTTKRTMETNTPEKHYVVRFIYESEDAHSIQVVGDFNGWNNEQTEMNRIPNTDLWIAEVVLTEGLYRYGFLIDNVQWVLDPVAKINMKDDFGKESSLIMLFDERENRKNL